MAGTTRPWRITWNIQGVLCELAVVGSDAWACAVGGRGSAVVVMCVILVRYQCNTHRIATRGRAKGYPSDIKRTSKPPRIQAIVVGVPYHFANKPMGLLRDKVEQ